MKAFITGSHAYGAPREDSDIDLVVFVDEATKELLIKHGGKPTRFGNLNIIAVSSQDQYDAWFKGTCQLIGMSTFEGPVSRETAKQVLDDQGVNRSDGPPSSTSGLGVPVYMG